MEITYNCIKKKTNFQNKCALWHPKVTSGLYRVLDGISKVLNSKWYTPNSSLAIGMKPIGWPWPNHSLSTLSANGKPLLKLQKTAETNPGNCQGKKTTTTKKEKQEEEENAKSFSSPHCFSASFWIIETWCPSNYNSIPVIWKNFQILSFWLLVELFYFLS